MSKFLYAALFLVASLSPLYGMYVDEKMYVDAEYDRQGTIFPNQTCHFKKEKNGSGTLIKRSPKDPTLRPATVEYINSEAILHYKYYEIEHPTFKVQSFFVTPNPGLTKDSTDFSSLPTAPYASIPVRLDSTAKKIELLIWEEGNKSSCNDYASTLAGALKILLNDYIPSVRDLPNLKTVKIHDSNRELETIILSSSFKDDVQTHFQRGAILPIQPQVNDFFEVTFNFKKPQN